VQKLGAPSYFLAYVNGKSAVRLRPRPRESDATTDGAAQQSRVSRLVPSSVHRWEGQKKKCAYFDPGIACVLHYVNCGLGAFRLKYEMLAECTTSDWFHALPLYPRARAAAAADRAARDVKSRANDSTSVTTGNAATDGRQLGACTSKIEKLYRDVVVLDDASAIAAQLDSGVCVRYNLGH
jgi:hypothetical protein